MPRTEVCEPKWEDVDVNNEAVEPPKDVNEAFLPNAYAFSELVVGAIFLSTLFAFFSGTDPLSEEVPEDPTDDGDLYEASDENTR